DSDINNTESLARNVDGAEQAAHHGAEQEFVLGWPGEVADLDTALNELEVEILARARERYESPALYPTDLESSRFY
ncbi:MAG TPA: hypothetical protein VGH54_18525, partial [Mycobacterium sp.]|uniref:hypothetical protein n=1 Tax=Mycobacterium sp. TaxID=1785 RepID=UPI002F4054C4